MLLAPVPLAKRLRDAGLLQQVGLKATPEQFRPEVDAEGNPVDTSFNLWHKVGGGLLLPKFHHIWTGRDTLNRWLNDAMAAGATLRQPNEHTEHDWDFKFTLYEPQENAVREVTALLHKETGGILNAKCGSGKTIMAMAVAERMRAGRIIVLVDQIDIAKQWQERIGDTIPDMPVKIVRGSKLARDIELKEPGALIIVAQTLMRTPERLSKPLQCDLLIVDEVHVFAAPSFYASMCQLDFRWSLGLSATIDRRDSMEWVFKALLGTTVVEAKTTSMLARVKQVKVPVPMPTKASFGTAWCKRHHRMTSHASCEFTCEHFKESYPNECGGKLPMKTQRFVDWGPPDTLHTLQTISKYDKYNQWLATVVAGLVKKRRQVLVLSKYVNHLVELALRTGKIVGEDKCGLYIGKARAGVSQAERQEALQRPVTFATYGVAEKALDIPHKDALVLALPVSDIRQAKGRVERYLPGKPEPIVIDPIFQHPSNLYYGSKSRRDFYKMTGSPVEIVG